jgi:hypothetical protein
VWVGHFAHLFQDAAVNEHAPRSACVYLKDGVAVVFKQRQETLGGVLKNRWDWLWVRLAVHFEGCEYKARNYWALYVMRRVNKLVKDCGRELLVGVYQQQPVRVCVVQEGFDHSIAQLAQQPVAFDSNEWAEPCTSSLCELH